MASGRFDEAEALLDDTGVMASDPDALNVKGALALARGRADAAFELLADAATAYPNHAGLASNLGVAHQLLGRSDEAVICLERATALAPDNEDVKLSLAQALLSRGDVAGARDLAAAAAERDPTNARAFLQLGAIDLATNDRSAAEASLLKALDLAPDNPEPLRNLSALYIEKGRWDEALQLAERAYVRAPLNSANLLHLAYCQAAAGRWPDAETSSRKLLAYAPSHAGAREVLARVMIARGDEDGGIAELRRIVRARKSDVAAALSLAQALQMIGRFEDAHKIASHAAGMAPSNDKAASLKATLELTLGRFPAVERAALPFMNSIVVPPTTDAFEFVVLSRMLKRLAARQVVRVVADARYQSLLGQLVEPVIPDEPHPASLAVPLQSLLRMLAVNKDNIADDIPYFRPDPQLLAKWQEALAEFPRPLVGIVWNGGALGLPMEHIAKLLPEDVTPVSLVMDENRHDLHNWNRPIDAGVHVESPADMLAAVACLDAVVGPDCFAIHLAGALGLPGVVLVPRGHPWYWMPVDGRALWYPSIEVVAQERLGDWDTTLAEGSRRLMAGLQIRSAQ
jgi:tetratricopeptide (TPR) repeat protein